MPRFLKRAGHFCLPHLVPTVRRSNHYITLLLFGALLTAYGLYALLPHHESIVGDAGRGYEAGVRVTPLLPLGVLLLIAGAIYRKRASQHRK